MLLLPKVLTLLKFLVKLFSNLIIDSKETSFDITLLFFAGLLLLPKVLTLLKFFGETFF